jgi:N-acetyl-1-D-myo-inositol-2-amino-2-deoxy-alpha-D-glucopyranoside deacetylase
VTPRDPLHDVRPGDRWLITVAHPDDETFGCGSLIAYAAQRGAEVTVLCATRGEEGERTGDVPADADLGAVRTEELHAAAAILGAHDVVLLDHRDSGFEGPMPVGAFCGVTVEDLAVELASVIERVAPTVVVTLDGSDGHRDHRHMRAATHEALARLEPARPEVVAEVALPNRLMRRWIEEMAVAHPEIPYLEMDPADFGTPDDRVTDVLHLDDLVDVRERAMAAHRSQRPPTDGLSRELTLAFIADASLVRIPR